MHVEIVDTYIATCTITVCTFAYVHSNKRDNSHYGVLRNSTKKVLGYA